MILRIEVSGDYKEQVAVQRAKEILQNLNWPKLLGEEVNEASPLKQPVEGVYVDTKLA